MKNMKLLKLILFSITISSGLFITIDEAKDIKKKNNDYKKIEEYIKPNKILTKDEYVGTIEIPKIKLKGGFYDLNNGRFCSPTICSTLHCANCSRYSTYWYACIWKLCT